MKMGQRLNRFLLAFVSTDLLSKFYYFLAINR